MFQLVQKPVSSLGKVESEAEQTEWRQALMDSKEMSLQKKSPLSQDRDEANFTGLSEIKKPLFEIEDSPTQVQRYDDIPRGGEERKSYEPKDVYEDLGVDDSSLSNKFVNIEITKPTSTVRRGD
jgi:hypothetical protein